MVLEFQSSKKNEDSQYTHFYPHQTVVIHMTPVVRVQYTVWCTPRTAL